MSAYIAIATIITIGIAVIVIINKLAISSQDNRKQIAKIGMKIFWLGFPFLIAYMILSVGRIIGIWK